MAAENVTFKLGDAQQLAQEGFTAVREEEWAAVRRRVKAMEAECSDMQYHGENHYQPQ
jgi:hypothetical protein